MSTLATGDRTETQMHSLLVKRILASEQFRRTVRLRDFLRYVAAHSIEHPGTSIPEHEIGTAVFDRRPDYDTAADNIVRVSAGDLRRRLEHYFLGEGLHEPIVLEMPRGGYALAFHSRVQALPTTEALTFPNVNQDQPQVFPSSDVPTPATPSLTGKLSWSSWWFDLRSVILIALFLTTCLLLGLYALRRTHEPWEQSSALISIWSPFLASGTETNVVLADTGLGLMKSITGRTVDLSDYVGYSYKELRSDPRLDDQTRRMLWVLFSRDIGSIGDFQAARDILALTTLPRQLVLGSAHDFTPEVIKRSNVILLGSSVSNPWVDLYRDQRSFVMEKDIPGHVAGIRNLDVQPGEQAMYRIDSGQDNVSDLAVIAILPNIDVGKRVFIIEGTDSQATRAASNFISSSAGAQAVLEHLKGASLPRHVEILLSSSKLQATPLMARIVAIHARDN